MTHIAETAAALGQIADAIRRATVEGERVVLEEDGKEVVALIPIEDLRWLEELEDRLDAEEAEKALAEFEASGEAAIPFEQICKERGI